MRSYKKKIRGNWDNNSYMTGLYNGIELSIATIENRKPIYKTTKERLILKLISYIKNFKIEIDLRS